MGGGRRMSPSLVHFPNFLGGHIGRMQQSQNAGPASLGVPFPLVSTIAQAEP